MHKHSQNQYHNHEGYQNIDPIRFLMNKDVGGLGVESLAQVYGAFLVVYVGFDEDSLADEVFDGFGDFVDGEVLCLEGFEDVGGVDDIDTFLAVEDVFGRGEL